MVEKTIFCPNKCNDIYLLRHTVKPEIQQGDNIIFKKRKWTAYYFCEKCRWGLILEGGEPVSQGFNREDIEIEILYELEKNNWKQQGWIS